MVIVLSKKGVIETGWHYYKPNNSLMCINMNVINKIMSKLLVTKINKKEKIKKEQ